MEKTLYKESRPANPLGCFIAYYLFLIPIVSIILIYIISITFNYIYKNFYLITVVFFIIKFIDFELTYNIKINQ